MIDIFFSYAHEDEELMHAVRKQLVIFDRNRRIAKWYDRKLVPGQKWNDEIDDHIRYSKIVLLFISPDFFESDYCYQIEMQQALRQHEAGDSIVIPIIARPCAWTEAPFSKIQALPRDGKPISRWNDRDEACLDVANGIMRAVEQLEKT